MSIKTEIERIRRNIAGAYDEIGNKNGVLPAVRNSENLQKAIETIPTGTDTSDATATARDIVSGITAYVNGEKLTGTMTTPGTNMRITGGSAVNYDNENFRVYAPATATRICLNKGVRVDITVPKSGFGNADPSDVRDGVEFTSANGIGLTGTMAEAPQVPAIRLINASDVDWYVRYYSVETGNLVKVTIPSGAEKTILALGGFLVYYGLLNEVGKTGQWEGNAEELLDETTLSNHTGNKFYLAAVEQMTEITLKIVKSGGIGTIG